MCLVLLLGVRLHAQETDPLFSNHPDLVSVLHIPNLKTTDASATAFLASLPGAAVPPPLFRMGLTQALHHDTLRGVKPDTPLDMLEFNPVLVREGARVWVFTPTTADGFFEDLLTAQRLREESTTNGITRYVLQEQGRIRHLYLSAHNDRIFFSNGSDGIRRAQTIYDTLPTPQLLPARREAVVLRVHVQRWVVAHQDNMRTYLSRLWRDLLFDMEGTTPSDGSPTHAMMDMSGALLLHHLRQAVILDAALVMDDAGLRLHGMLAFQDGEMLHHAMQTVPVHPLTLPARLPAEVVSIRASKIWPAQMAFLYEIVGEMLLAGFATAPSQDRLDVVHALRDTFLALQPREVVAGILPATEAGGGPVQVGLIEWGSPEAAKTWWGRVESELTGGVLSDLLTENGLKIEIHAGTTTRLGEDAVRRVRIRIRSSPGALRWPGVTEEDRTWYVAWHGDVLAVVTPSAPASTERNPHVERTCLLAMQTMLKSLRGGNRPPLAVALHPENVEDIFFQLAVQPLAYTQEAVQASAVWLPLTEGRDAPDWLQFAREFSATTASAPPLTLSVRTLEAHRRGQGVLQFRLHLPQTTIAEFIRASLTGAE